MENVTLPKHLKRIELRAFMYSKIKTLVIPEEVNYIGDASFSRCDSLESVKILSNNITFDGYSFFGACYKLSQYEGYYASEDNRCLVVDGVLKDIAPAGLTEYTIPDGIKEIGGYSFMNYSNFEKISISESVTKIGKYAFNNCQGFTEITIPKNVTTIEEYAFKNCLRLVKFYCEPTAPPMIMQMAFDGTHNQLQIYVPTTAINVYKTANVWKDYADKIVGYDF